MTPQKIRAIFRRFQARDPHPTTELVWHTPFELLISVILSAQATDVSVNRATQKLFAVANTPEALLTLGEKCLKKYISSIGLYNSKAKNILATCHRLITRHASQCPDTREALEALPGVGRKTANVMLNTCFGQSVIAVDTHIFRVTQRIGLAKGNTPRVIEQQLVKNIPKPFLQNAHHWLILHGRYTCVARKPRCPDCLIRDLCEFPDKM